ncbi:MAG: 3-methyl-2-oxobutanoate hydroxymethyltransferase [Kiritimatiellae bacterium]|jgi:3-methyl-2-oxobutanoate hydroxymethyltransferase|nr:3-methyl-2-oxobutanoate hydroxymethyltransferase [Kiritimatiellia bacterium]
MTPWTSSRIRGLKHKQKFATVTVFDYTSAKFADQAGIPFLLVGDSLGMTVLGHESTLTVTMEQMLHHTLAASRGTSQALLVADLPFLSYQISEEEALRNAGRFLQEAGADAVKLEGGTERASTIARLVSNGIPVTGHIGLTPQSVKQLGYKVQGREPAHASKLKADALAIQEAGAFALVLEACPAPLAKEITDSLEIPTIGIGAGPYCDAQILVFHDLLGMYENFTPKFVKQYAQIGDLIRVSLKEYVHDVEQGRFPGPEHSYD